MFNGVPLRSGRRVVGHGHRQAVLVAEAMLRVELPGARRAAVAAAAVGQDLQGRGVGIALAALGAPPLLDAIDGERRGVGGSADEDGAGIGAGGRNAVGDGDPSASDRRRGRRPASARGPSACSRSGTARRSPGAAAPSPRARRRWRACQSPAARGAEAPADAEGRRAGTGPGSGPAAVRCGPASRGRPTAHGSSRPATGGVHRGNRALRRRGRRPADAANALRCRAVQRVAQFAQVTARAEPNLILSLHARHRSEVAS